MSPKNKGKFGKGKSEIEEQDEFVSGVNRFFDVIKPYAKRIGVTLGVVVVGFLGYVIYDWYQDRAEREGTELYIAATDVLRHQVVVDDPLIPEEPKPKNPEDVTPADRKPPTYKTTKEHAEKELAALEKLASQAGDSAAGTHGELLRARALLDLGRHDEALAIYQSYASDSNTEVVRTVALEGVGYALEAKALASEDPGAREAGLKKALEAFRKVQPKEKGTRWHYALYHEARILATLDDKAKAGEIYQKILDSEPPAALEDSVTSRLALLDVAPPVPPAPKDESADGATDDTDEAPEEGDEADGDKTTEAPAPGQ